MTDADWAVKHSTSGWVFRFCRAAITWGSKKQKSVALSSCESEIMAASEAAKEAVALNRMFTELGLKNEDEAIELGCDNQAAINLSYNPEHITIASNTSNVVTSSFVSASRMVSSQCPTSTRLITSQTSPRSPFKGTISSPCETQL